MDAFNGSPCKHVTRLAHPPLVYFLLDLPAALFHESVTSEGLRQQQKPEAQCNAGGSGVGGGGGCIQRVNLIWHIMQHMAPICFQLLGSFRQLVTFIEICEFFWKVWAADQLRTTSKMMMALLGFCSSRNTC